MDKDTNTDKKVVITGQSQITVNRKWVSIIVGIVVVFTVSVGWMYQVVATARPVSEEFAKAHPLQ